MYQKHSKYSIKIILPYTTYKYKHINKKIPKTKNQYNNFYRKISIKNRQ